MLYGLLSISCASLYDFCGISYGFSCYSLWVLSYVLWLWLFCYFLYFYAHPKYHHIRSVVVLLGSPAKSYALVYMLPMAYITTIRFLFHFLGLRGNLRWCVWYALSFTCSSGLYAISYGRTSNIMCYLPVVFLLFIYCSLCFPYCFLWALRYFLWLMRYMIYQSVSYFLWVVCY